MKGNFKDRNIWVNSIKLTQAAIIGFNKRKMEQILPQIEE